MKNTGKKYLDFGDGRIATYISTYVWGCVWEINVITISLVGSFFVSFMDVVEITYCVRFLKKKLLVQMWDNVTQSSSNQYLFQVGLPFYFRV